MSHTELSPVDSETPGHSKRVVSFVAGIWFILGLVDIIIGWGTPGEGVLVGGIALGLLLVHLRLCEFAAEDYKVVRVLCFGHLYYFRHGFKLLAIPLFPWWLYTYYSRLEEGFHVMLLAVAAGIAIMIPVVVIHWIFYGIGL